MPSNTLIDMAKVNQMLDNGWTIELFKNQIGTYTARGTCINLKIWNDAKDKVLAQVLACNDPEDHEGLRELNDEDFEEPGVVDTDDFTPEQALTRLAYKVQGEIL